MINEQQEAAPGFQNSEKHLQLLPLVFVATTTKKSCITMTFLYYRTVISACSKSSEYQTGLPEASAQKHPH